MNFGRRPAFSSASSVSRKASIRIPSASSGTWIVSAS